MSIVMFPAYRPDQPQWPAIGNLCTHCGHLELHEPDAGRTYSCPCPDDVHRGEEYPVIALGTVDKTQVWEQLTPHVPDHVIGRVLRVMYGQEKP